MALPPIRILSLCSGVGMLDVGVDLALRAVGARSRSACYVERDAFAASVLVARMEDKTLGAAPVWDDLKTFDGRPWRGAVDCVIGGYPCQPFSHAGRRLGADDPRHLWPDIDRIIGEVNPAIAFFENVRGHATLGFGDVRAALRKRGYRVAQGLFSSLAAGASHVRERLYILAVLADSEGVGRGSWRAEPTGRQGESILARIGDELGYSEGVGFGAGRQRPREAGESLSPESSQPLVDADSNRCAGPRLHARPGEEGEGTPGASGRGGALAYSGGEGLEGRRNGAVGPCSQQSLPSGLLRAIYAPGPKDHDAWRDILEREPLLAPALESVLYKLSYGMASGLDGPIVPYRTDQLRCVGNGVDPHVAAEAFITLLIELLKPHTDF